MKYYINLFSPNTALAFSESDQEISGFRISRKAYVENQHINIGDKFICYCTKIQRFIGILEITSNFFIDSKPIFTQEDDPFTLRFKVKPIAWLPLEKGIPIHKNIIWDHLSLPKSCQMIVPDGLIWYFPVPDFGRKRTANISNRLFYNNNLK